ncbi:MAG: hypothetical protein ACP5TO_01600 [Thermoplasmata archaeon]
MKIQVKGKEFETDICKMSDNPLKLGIGIKITDPIWSILKEEKKFKIDENECIITDEVDIGDRTWYVFIFKNSKMAKKYLK